MKFTIIFLVVTVILTDIQGKNLSPGRQLLNNSLPSQTAPQRFKEVILYLTPSQIRALEQGQGLINPQQIRHLDSHKYAQTLQHQQNELPQPHPNRQFHPQLDHSQSVKPTSSQELQAGLFIPILPPPHNSQPESVASTNFKPQNQKRFLKPIPFFPDPNNQSHNEERKASTTQDAPQEKDYEAEITRQQLKERWLNLLLENIAHFKALQALPQQPRPSGENKTNFHYLSQNEQRYSDQTYASEVYNLVRTNNEHLLEKQRALLQAEAAANSSPILVHKEINIKHNPHLIAHVPVPVPTPVFIPVHDSFKMKTPGAYEVPLEISGTVPMPIVKQRINDVARQMPTDFEKVASVPTTKNVFVDRPFFVDHSASGQNQASNQGNRPVHNHVWHH